MSDRVYTKHGMRAVPGTVPEDNEAPDTKHRLSRKAARALFILWDPKDGEPRRDENGAFLTSGTLGCITADNVYLRTYAQYPDERRPSDLTEVGQRIENVRYSLSGASGIYTVIRVQ